MIKKFLSISLFTLLTLPFIILCVPIAGSSDAPIILDPPVQDVKRWDNAWTETFFGDGSPPFKTVIYSEPQAVWNGTSWVRYELKPISMSSVILRTSKCTYIFGPTSILLFDPNRTALRVSGMDWIIEQYSITLDKWLPKAIKNACIGYNGSHVWQKWTFMDESERTLYISGDNKQTVTFNSKSSATYRLIWRFTNTNATRMVYENGTCIELEEGYSLNSSDFCFSKLAFFNDESLSLFVDCHEITQSYHREFRLGCLEKGFANVELVYGNWTLGVHEVLAVDPETKTFGSEANLDGTLLKSDTTYEGALASTQWLWSPEIYVGQEYDGTYYWIYRGYVSFDTSAIRDYAVIINATLRLKTVEDHSVVDFATKVMGGPQPIYGASLEASDWGCGTTEAASWPSSNYPGDNAYINITIPTDQINTKGRTQFELKSDLEGTKPCGTEYPQYIKFYAAETAGSEPQLEVTWLPNTEYVKGTYWYYWKHSSNKAVILLYGGLAWRYKVRVRSIFLQDDDGLKEKVIHDLYSNGFDVLSPQRDAALPPTEEDYVDYYSTSDWVYNATMWLLSEKGYDYIYLFGFSAGGVAAAYEIQKDYAHVFSGAVVASAPVDADSWSSDPIFQSAHTANNVKTCTSFIVAVNDTYTGLGDFYKQMSTYFNNTNAHKEWHKWEDGADPHDIFPDKCLTDPNETVSEAVNNWFEKHSTPLRNPSFEERLRSVYGCAHWETDRPGWRELRGDVNQDGKCDLKDIYSVYKAYGSQVGDPKYVWLLDFDGDGKIDLKDYYLVNQEHGKTSDRIEGSYSWYVSEGGYCHIWQWLNHSVDIIKGKKIMFEYWFKPETLPAGGFAQAMIYYIDDVGERLICSDNIYYTETKWYNVSVTMPWPFPSTTTTIKLIIRGKPDFKARVDNSTLTTLP